MSVSASSALARAARRGSPLPTGSRRDERCPRGSSRRPATAWLRVGVLGLAVSAGLAGLAGCGAWGVPARGMDDNHPPHPSTIALDLERDVDILFVVDNSASMAREQATLARSAEALIGALEAPGADMNYRIGFTTTDNGNAQCAVSGVDDTTPEAGALRATSCSARAEEFEWPHSNPVVEAYDEACAAQCPAELGDALSIAPSPIAPLPYEEDMETRPRPWLERVGDETNVRLDGESFNDMAAAVRCMAPQGVDGCGFESQLESQYKAIGRSQISTDAQYGFVRPQANVAIVHVTDEADCSANLRVDELVFASDVQDSPFWTDDVPTSGICWNAGTRCEGDGAPYDSCVAQSYNYLGEEVSEVYDFGHSDQEHQVLLPVDRYIEQLEELQLEKEIYGGRARGPVVAVISGVPEGYAAGAADLVYQEDPETDAALGIGLGCEVLEGQGEGGAVPPVRLRTFAEAFAPEGGLGRDAFAANLFSVCADDYGPALRAVVEAAVPDAGDRCYPGCVRDMDPDTAGLQVDCRLIQERVNPLGEYESTDIPTCDEAPIPNDIGACYELQVDGDLEPACAEQGYNVSFFLRRDLYAPVWGGAGTVVSCKTSKWPDQDCPDMF